MSKQISTIKSLTKLLIATSAMSAFVCADAYGAAQSKAKPKALEPNLIEEALARSRKSIVGHKDGSSDSDSDSDSEFKSAKPPSPLQAAQAEKDSDEANLNRIKKLPNINQWRLKSLQEKAAKSQACYQKLVDDIKASEDKRASDAAKAREDAIRTNRVLQELEKEKLSKTRAEQKNAAAKLAKQRADAQETERKAALGIVVVDEPAKPEKQEVLSFAAIRARLDNRSQPRAAEGAAPEKSLAQHVEAMFAQAREQNINLNPTVAQTLEPSEAQRVAQWEEWDADHKYHEHKGEFTLAQWNEWHDSEIAFYKKWHQERWDVEADKEYELEEWESYYNLHSSNNAATPAKGFSTDESKDDSDDGMSLSKMAAIVNTPPPPPPPPPPPKRSPDPTAPKAPPPPLPDQVTLDSSPEVNNQTGLRRPSAVKHNEAVLGPMIAKRTPPGPLAPAVSCDDVEDLAEPLNELFAEPDSSSNKAPQKPLVERANESLPTYGGVGYSQLTPSYNLYSYNPYSSDKEDIPSAPKYATYIIDPSKQAALEKKTQSQAAGQAVQVTNAVASVINAAALTNIDLRLGEVTVVDTELGAAGVAAGDSSSSKPKGLWITGFAGSSKQGQNRDLAGYKGKLLGATLGFDLEFNDKLTLGIAYSNARSRFNYRQNRAGDNISANSNILSLYSQALISDKLIWKNIASFSMNNITTKNNRLNVLARGKFKNYGLNFDTNLGYLLAKDNMVLIPNIGLKCSFSKDSEYKETGAGDYNVSVNSKSNHSLAGILGARFALKHKLTSGAEITPSIHGSIETKLIDKQQKVKAKFAYMDGYFDNNAQTGAKAPKLAYNLGGWVAIKKNNIELSVNYNCNIMNKYKAHQGSVKLKISL